MSLSFIFVVLMRQAFLGSCGHNQKVSNHEITPNANLPRTDPWGHEVLSQYGSPEIENAVERVNPKDVWNYRDLKICGKSQFEPSHQVDSRRNRQGIKDELAET